MATSRSRKRSLRLAVILPPLVFLTVFGYWRFLGSSACRRLVEVVLGRALGARVTIGAHEIARPSEIELSDLRMELLAEGSPSGVRFTARRASAHAARLLGLGPFERVVLEDPEARFRGVGRSITRLTVLRSRGAAGGVERVEFRNMALVFELSGFEAHGNVYRVGGIDLVLDFTGGSLRISADLGELRIEGVQSAKLEEEKPEIGFDVEIAESKVVLRRLSVKGRSGWKMDGEIEVDLSGKVPEIRGELQLRDLKVSTIRALRPGISVTTPAGESAAVRRTIRFEGTFEDLRVSAETDMPEFIYEDTTYHLKVEGTTLKGLRREMRTSVKELLRGLLGEVGSTTSSPNSPDEASWLSGLRWHSDRLASLGETGSTTLSRNSPDEPSWFSGPRWHSEPPRLLRRDGGPRRRPHHADRAESGAEPPDAAR